MTINFPKIGFADDRLMSARWVRQRYGNISDKTLRQRITKGTFPAVDVYVGNRRHWWLSTILEYERGLPTEREAA